MDRSLRKPEQLTADAAEGRFTPLLHAGSAYLRGLQTWDGADQHNPIIMKVLSLMRTCFHADLEEALAMRGETEKPRRRAR